MSLLNISNLYAYIHKILREDKGIQLLMFNNTAPSLEVAAMRIQKRSSPQNLNVNNFPLISFYSGQGMRGDNYLEYVMPFDFDIYTKDDVELALKIADRINKIFENEYVGLECDSQFKSMFVTMGEEQTDQSNTFKFFTRILFTLGMEE